MRDALWCFLLSLTTHKYNTTHLITIIMLFEDVFEVTTVNAEGKKFDKG